MGEKILYCAQPDQTTTKPGLKQPKQELTRSKPGINNENKLGLDRIQLFLKIDLTKLKTGLNQV